MAQLKTKNLEFYQSHRENEALHMIYQYTIYRVQESKPFVPHPPQKLNSFLVVNSKTRSIALRDYL